MKQTYHFIGIGGIGMSALARILLQKNENVQGSDSAYSKIIDELKTLGANIYPHHSAENLQNSNVVIYSTDIKEDNEELKMARNLKLKCFHRSEFLAQLMQETKSLLVTGTHGKTTTSSLLAHVLSISGLDPSFAVGGIVKNFQSNSRFGSGEYFVAEADESDGSFLAYPCYGAIVTNIDLDHLSHWQTEDALIRGFESFISKVRNPSLLFYCGDDERLSKLNIKGVGYGFSSSCSIQIKDLRRVDQCQVFSLEWNGEKFKDISLPLMGSHNVLNATAVFALCISLGVKEVDIRSSFLSFEGVGRRADLIGRSGSISVFDDYGHHPTEIKATVKAFKEAYPSQRLITIFQPHRYSRTKDCLNEFSNAFNQSDIVVLTDLYSAGELPIEGIDTQAVYDLVLQDKENGVYYIKKDFLIEFLSSFLKDGDIVLTMGAGDITKYGPNILERIKK